MADLTQVAEVLAEHEPTVIEFDFGAVMSGCECDGALDLPDWPTFAAHQAQMLADAGLVATETEWGMFVPAFNACPTGGDVFDTEAEARMRARYEVDSRWAMGNPIAIARREVTPWQTVEDK